MEFTSPEKLERTFRALLLNVSENLGEEAWRSFLFIFGVPERVREGVRADVLTYLVTSGAVSSKRPLELAALLRDNLHRDDLAARVDAFAEKTETPLESTKDRDALYNTDSSTAVETRARRRTHSPDRRHAKVFTGAELGVPMNGYTAQGAGSLDGDAQPRHDHCSSVEEAAAMEERFLQSLGLKGYDVSPEEKGPLPVQRATLPRARNSSAYSSFSRDSDCSSGYFSVRDSLASTDSIISLDPIAMTDESVRSSYISSSLLLPPTLSSLPEVPLGSPPNLDRLASSASSSSDEDFYLCNSGSGEDLVDSKGTSAARQSSLEIIHSPISSNTQRKVTVQMCMERKDILRDINLKGGARRSRMYKSYPPFPRQRGGLQFQLRFYPTSLQKSAAAALYIDVVSVRNCDEASIPALDITVSVSDSKALLSRESAMSDEADHIAFHRHLCSSGYLFEKEYECIALFPQLVTHRALQQIVGSAVVIQVIMEYSL